MDGLTASLLGRACRIFLQRAYPGGGQTIPPAKRAFLDIAPDDALEPLLTPAVCQVLRHPGGRMRGYSLRLGSADYPHLKLQLVNCETDSDWVLSVDTHDRIPLAPGDPDASRWAEIQAANQQLKERIEKAWETEGLLTFKALLRRATAGGGN